MKIENALRVTRDEKQEDGSGRRTNKRSTRKGGKTRARGTLGEEAKEEYTDVPRRLCIRRWLHGGMPRARVDADAVREDGAPTDMQEGVEDKFCV